MSAMKNGFILLLAALTLFLASAPIYADELPPAQEAPPAHNPSLYAEDPTRRPEKKALDTSGPSRFKGNGDGTVTDPETALMWRQTDSYQLLKKWLNWEMAQTYVTEMNRGKFAGYDDWRLPTREELRSLYDESKTVQWMYYWNVYDVHIDPVFGETGCCFWSSESYKDIYAWGFNFIRGTTYMSIKGGASQSLSVIRPVRSLKKN